MLGVVVEVEVGFVEVVQVAEVADFVADVEAPAEVAA
jgi:hypothetical protein